MIKATILHNKEGLAVGFKVENHGDTHVCAAVSMLTINTVNSITKLTDVSEDDVIANWDDAGGFLEFKLKNVGQRNSGAGLLLDALVLGLTDVSQEYPKDIDLKGVDYND